MTINMSRCSGQIQNTASSTHLMTYRKSKAYRHLINCVREGLRHFNDLLTSFCCSFLPPSNFCLRSDPSKQRCPSWPDCNHTPGPARHAWCVLSASVALVWRFQDRIFGGSHPMNWLMVSKNSTNANRAKVVGVCLSVGVLMRAFGKKLLVGRN